MAPVAGKKAKKVSEREPEGALNTPSAGYPDVSKCRGVLGPSILLVGSQNFCLTRSFSYIGHSRWSLAPLHSWLHFGPYLTLNVWSDCFLDTRRPPSPPRQSLRMSGRPLQPTFLTADQRNIPEKLLRDPGVQFPTGGGGSGWWLAGYRCRRSRQL